MPSMDTRTAKRRRCWVSRRVRARHSCTGPAAYCGRSWAWRFADMVSANDKGERKVSSLRDLPRDVQPPRDLWSGIEARIVADRRAADGVPDERRAVPPGRSSSLRWIAAAAVVAALAVGMWIGRSLLPTTGGPTTGPGGSSGM